MRRKVLVLCRLAPSPAVSGARMRIQQHVAVLSRDHDVRVFCVRTDDVRAQGAGMKDDIRVRPTPVWLARRLADFARDPRRLVTDILYDEAAAARLETVLRTFRPDVALFEEIWLHRFLPVVRRHPCTVILDMHNIETPLYEAISKSARGLAGRTRAAAILRASRETEEPFARAADVRWVCSEEDRAALRERTGLDAAVIPNAVDTGRYAAGAERRDDLLFLGSFLYEPNADAAQVLLEEIFPVIARARPGTRLLLAGAAPTARMRRMAADDARIVVTGARSDLRPYLASSRLLLAPIRRGGGTRLKIIEAMAAGLPVVTTPKGAEGLRLEDGVHAVIREGHADLADAALRLLERPEECERLADAARRLAVSRYSWDAVAPATRAAMEHVPS